jgi:hypothetical protein
MMREGGWGATWALVFCALGVIAGIVALSLLPVSRKTGHVVGVVALMLSFLAPAVGLLAMARQRHGVDEAVARESERPGRSARMRHDGYRESQSAARIGFYACIAPLLLGATAAFLGTRKMEDAKVPRAFAGVTCGFAFLTGLGACAASNGPLPPDVSLEASRLQDAAAEIRNVSGGGLGAGCWDLEHTVNELYWHSTDKKEWPRHFDPELRVIVPDFDALASQCVRSRMSYAAQNDLLTSPLLVDDALKKEIGEVHSGGWTSDTSIGDSFADRGLPGKVTLGSPTVSGRLPPEVIQRIVRYNTGRYRRCYADGLARSSSLHGRITVKFTIGHDGAVASTSNGGSDLGDPAVVKCVVQAFENLSFPQPEGGNVTVQFPLVFTAEN